MKNDALLRQVYESNDGRDLHAIEALKEAGAANVLLAIVRNPRGLSAGVDVAAVRAIGEIGGKNEAAELIHELDIRRGIVIGGSEGQVAHRKMKEALVQAISHLLGLQPIQALDAPSVVKFVTEARKRLESNLPR